MAAEQLRFQDPYIPRLNQGFWESEAYRLGRGLMGLLRPLVEIEFSAEACGDRVCRSDFMLFIWESEP